MNGGRSIRAERGLAMLWTILVMLVVLGTVAVAVGMTLVRTDETKDQAQRTRSTLWMNAAADDIVQRLQSREIGYDWDTIPPIDWADPFGKDVTFVVPTPGTSPSGAEIRTFPNPGPTAGTTNARLVTFTRGGKEYRGWYQVLPLVGTTTPWRALFHRKTKSDQGSVEMLVRAWEEGIRSEPVTARLTFRHASFSRFALLSDDRLHLGGLGTVDPSSGFIHSNNAHDDPTAIEIEGSADLGGSTVTTTQGAISGTCSPTARCVPNVGDVVEFGAAARAFDRVFQQSGQTIATVGVNYAAAGVSRYVDIQGAGGTDRMPATLVDIDGDACGGGANVAMTPVSFSLRTDTVGVPAIDDRFGPVLAGATQCFSVADGGGAFLVNGDVVVRGVRFDQLGITVMAQRRRTVNVLLDTDGDGVASETARVTQPASIYLEGDNVGGSGLGAFGLVAEGGVYVPSYNMLDHPDYMYVSASAMAAGSEIGYGPSIISVAAESDLAADDPTLGLGLSPHAARALDYGHSLLLDWSGSLASRRPITFRYGTGADYLGYEERTFNYPTNLLWNSPPGYPTDRDWHLTDYEEFDS